MKEYLFWLWYMKRRVAVEGERDERQHLLELISSNIFTTDCRLILGCLFIYPLILPTLCYPMSPSLIYYVIRDTQQTLPYLRINRDVLIDMETSHEIKQ